MRAGAPLRTAGGPGSASDGPEAAGTLVEVARAAVRGAGSRGGEGEWEFAVEGFWCTARPSGTQDGPAQGWKLHVSAAGEAAGQVLEAVASVLATDPCPFKFTADRERLHEINSRNSDRGSAGKFITVYPADNAQFLRLAGQLHQATEGLPGPGVLSDRAYAPGSRVHYRYGVFTGRAELGNDGAYRSMLTGPDGRRLEDQRTASYRCPPWVVDPVEGKGSTTAATAATAPKSRGGGVLLGGRYAITAAVRHSAKGGVFLGRDTSDDSEVVVKQARAHIEVDRSGREARTALRHEAMLLTRLDGQGLTPRPVELIEQDDSLFLVQERIPGVSLASWVAARLRRDGSPDVPWAEAGPMALALTDLLGRVHAQGLVLRDLTPGNVMVRPDGSLRLVDLELAAPAGAAAGTAGTPGYRAPEQGPGDTTAVADPSADHYALGGLFFLLATGHDPLLPEDTPMARPAAERIGRWLEQAARVGETARRLAPVILALRAEEPARRWGLEHTRAALTSPVGHPAPTAVLSGQSLDRFDRVVRDGLRHLASTAAFERRDRIWPTVPAGQLTDPANVQHGAGGVLAVLARAAASPLLAGVERELCLETAALTAEWLERRSAAEPTALPGLHFGRSGIAWALLDAAEVLGDRQLAARAVELGRGVPYVWPNPDICHGAAGAGFLQLRLHRSTGSAEFLERAGVCADALVAAATEEPYGTVWQVPKSFDSALAGVTHLGYGHGVAGVGAFLLAAGRPEAAQRAVRTLAATVRPLGETAKAAWWPQSAGDPEHIRLQHWCNGSSGVGSFLLRYWQATGDDVAYELALGAGQAVLDSRWHSGTSACHGLAGNGEYLLDLAEATGEARFRTGAEELATLITTRAALRDSLLVLPDETGTGCAPAYGTGYSGALAFLLRLRHGGPRLWLDV